MKDVDPQKIREDFLVSELLADFELLMSVGKRLREKGESPALAIAAWVATKTMWDRVEFTRLLDLLREKDVVTLDDKTKLDESIDAMHDKFVKALVEKHPEFSQLDPRFFNSAKE
jgi:hypothetical protein